MFTYRTDIYHNPNTEEILELKRIQREKYLHLPLKDLALMTGLELNALVQARKRQVSNASGTDSLDLLGPQLGPLFIELWAQPEDGHRSAWNVDCNAPVGLEVLEMVYPERFENGIPVPCSLKTKCKTVDDDEDEELAYLNQSTLYQNVEISKKMWNEKLLNGEKLEPRQKTHNLNVLLNIFRQYKIRWELRISRPIFALACDYMPNLDLPPQEKVCVACINSFQNLMLVLQHGLYHIPIDEIELDDQAQRNPKKVGKAKRRAELNRDICTMPIRYMLLYVPRWLCESIMSNPDQQGFYGILVELDQDTDLPQECDAADLSSKYNYLPHNQRYRLFHISSIKEILTGGDGDKLLRKIGTIYAPRFWSFSIVKLYLKRRAWQRVAEGI